MIEQLWDKIFPSRKEYIDLLKRVERLEDEVSDLENDDLTGKVKAKRVVVRPGGVRDDLTRIKGVGEVNQEKLYNIGIIRMEQLARMGASEVEELEQKLGLYTGQIQREEWIAQAKKLISRQP